MESKLHKLIIDHGKIKLDDFVIEGVTEYEIKSSAKPGSLTELTLKIKVKDFKTEI